MSIVHKHLRTGKNKKSVVRTHNRNTHRVRNGRKEVFVDGFWKHDDYPNAPKSSWPIERLLRERSKLAKDLDEGLHGGFMVPRKYGLLTRRIRKINRLIKSK